MDDPTALLSTRLMQLKVLYSFDSENKNNCLARWPHVLNVPTAALDETTLIGVVELKACVQAIISASPELISNLGNDFNIYAYDYSEPDVPLVGQGLLSWALAANTTAPGAEDASPSLVTGRVTRGGLALFSKNAHETLEVKLRLAPVPSSTQNGILNSLQKCIQASGVTGTESGAQAWTNSIQRSPGSTSVNPTAQPAARSASPMDRTQLELMPHMLSDGPATRVRSGSLPVQPFSTPNSAHPLSRPSTPMLAQPFNPPARLHGPSSRPSSGAGTELMLHQRRESFNSGYFSAEESFEDGPTKKRAKTIKVDWPSKSSLNIERQPDSLRVAASTASSVRIHRPIPVNPTLALETGAPIEESVRPPTPIPKAGRARGRPPKSTSSRLRRGSNARPSSPAIDQHPSHTQYPSAPQSQAGETAMLSPENVRPPSISSTPANIPSSPPVMETVNTFPSSPALPPLLGEDDSGFMSGTFDVLFDNGNPLRFDDFLKQHEVAADATSLFQRNEVAPMPGPFGPVFEEGNIPKAATSVSLPSVKPVSRAEDSTAPLRRAQSSRPASPKPGPKRYPQVQQSINEADSLLEAPQVHASEPVGPSLRRSHTWAGDASDVPASDAPLGEGSQTRVGSQQKKRVGKAQTKARLEAAIASGDLPPYCENCGAIETPAWRRAYARTFEGGYDQFETSLLDGEPCFKKPLDHKEDGSVRVFRAYKTVRKPEDREDEWVLINLCNPCGLWFQKFKCMRPPEKYEKSRKEPKGKRKRSSRTKTGRSATKKARSGSDDKSDSQTAASDASSPSDTATDAAHPQEGDHDGEEDTAGETVDAGDAYTEPELPPVPKSVHPIVADSTINTAASGPNSVVPVNHPQRSSVSSPARTHDSEAEPIEIDPTPQPLQRQLFSSPRKILSRESDAASRSGTTSRPLSDLPNFVRRSPRINKTRDAMDCPKTPGKAPEKENRIPVRSGESGLDDVFNDGNDDIQPQPTTPTPTRRSGRILLKTPSKTPSRRPGSSYSPNTRRSHPASQEGTDRHPAAAALLGSNKNVAEMTPFTRQIHQLLSDAPHQQSQSSPSAPPSNYRRRIADENSSGDQMDYPDLPSLKNSSPLSHSYAHINFSELTTDRLQTDFNHFTDLHMPSSPPIGFFNLLDNHDDGMDLGETLWSDLGITHANVTSNGPIYPDPVASAIGQGASSGPSRSPRKR